MPAESVTGHWPEVPTDKVVAPDKAAELAAGPERVPLPERQRELQRLGDLPPARLRRVADVVGDAVGSLQQQQHLHGSCNTSSDLLQCQQHKHNTSKLYSMMLWALE